MHLSSNKISNINPLLNVNFKELTALTLDFNEISDISVFEKVEFNELKHMCLSYNKINEKDNTSIISNLKSKISKFYILF